jgi:hypothetical protein
VSIGEPTRDSGVKEPLLVDVVDGSRATASSGAAHRKRRTVATPALALKLQGYYQLECTQPTSARLQIWLNEILRKAHVNAAMKRRVQSAEDI